MINEAFLTQYWWLILLIAAWTLPWKGVAMWKASKNNHTIWFIVFLVLNDLAILEILYIFWFSKRSSRIDE